MTSRISAVAVAVAVAALAAFAAPASAGVEAVETQGRAAFIQAAALPAASVGRFQRAALPAALPAILGANEGFTSVTPVSVGQQAPSGRSQDVALEPLLNRHLKTSLRLPLGGTSVWISGGFNRAEKPSVALTEDSKPSRYFDVEALLDSPELVDVGNAKYQLSLSPNLSDRLGSKIVLTNAANRKDQHKITLRDMLAAVAAAGETASIGGQSYRVFYYDDIEDGQAGARTRSFAFILTDASGEFHVYLIPAEIIPADRAALFKMLGGAVVGLQKAGSVLKIFDNPSTVPGI